MKKEQDTDGQEDKPVSIEFDRIRRLQIEFTDGRKRTYWADSYEVNSSMVHLFCTIEGEKSLSHMIPYMLIRHIEIMDPELKGLLKGKG